MIVLRIVCSRAVAAWPSWCSGKRRAARRQRRPAVPSAAALQQQAAEHHSRSEQQGAADACHEQKHPEPPPLPPPLPRFEALMQHARLTHIAQDLWGHIIRPGDLVVDATCGNGHDTAFLAQAVGPQGTVHAFDIQPAALNATQALLARSVAEGRAPTLHCHLASHADMLQHVGSGSARVIVFNLGYLPGSDKSTTTQEGSTLVAVRAACEALMPGGLCSILCYTGHPGGMEEYKAVRELVGELPPAGWVSSEVRLLNRPTAPVLLLVWKAKAQAKRR